MRMGLPLGGGIGGIVLLLLYSALTGTNPIDIVNSGAPTEETAPTGVPANDQQAQFISVVLKSTEDVWSQVFSERGARYEPPVLVLFSDATQSACGLGQSAMGPFYCPRDRKVYLDLSFFQDLANRFGAPGDFARAYVVAHEVGHHVQTLTGLSDRVAAAREQGDRAGSNQLSVPAGAAGRLLCGRVGPLRGASRICSSLAMRKKAFAPRLRSATTACSVSRRAGWCRSRSRTARPPSASSG